jgi:hypothetical protein
VAAGNGEDTRASGNEERGQKTTGRAASNSNPPGKRSILKIISL